MTFRLLFFLCFFLLASCAKDKRKAQNNVSNTEGFKEYELIVPDLNIPWGFAFLPDSSILVTEKTGELIHFKNDTKTTIEGLPDIYVRGQGGLLDVELHPDYSNTGWIYFTFASSTGEGSGGNTTLYRAKLDNQKLVDGEVLYKAEPNSRRGQHFGSRIEFDNDGYLYFTIGDRGNRDDNPQDISKDCGKVYRLHDDGRIPEDNPFVNNPEAKKSDIFLWSSQCSGNDQTSNNWSHLDA